ncbi:maleylpyruvate isomerase family mycothiol-dependent enzyme [Streptomyces edwardsiae]|uniref:Maleylpyruvate isomerase family mycothiol-dependent enzyme n=1 Tax=Streptomyces edwardsiae TaxID=3075527 RepID=A0ABU2QQH3_9ACTN|nr:maleylpyruvate isomerase family mycothiol-dependent enzyme [Streptomyces sp. DSM 41635]MDT0405225.1 maleylpyruvate isomerase family mycothiol-dependent enzyme [Streptomyces sp. DSM 41635]
MTTPADVRNVRDPELPGRLLAVERDALIPLLRGRPEGDFALPVPACPGWSVRDVLAHCSAAFARVLERRYEDGVFSPESNERDIAERAGWTNARVVDELEHGMTEAGPLIAGAGGALDGLALGEWVHAGDVRDALGEPGAYAGAGLPYALALLGQVTGRNGRPPLHADLDDADEPLRFGDHSGERPPARYIGDGPTLVRLYAGRSVDGAAYELAGVEAAELNIFGG